MARKSVVPEPGMLMRYHYQLMWVNQVREATNHSPQTSGLYPAQRAVKIPVPIVESLNPVACASSGCQN